MNLLNEVTRMQQLAGILTEIKTKISNYEIIDSTCIGNLNKASMRVIDADLISRLIDTLVKFEYDEAQKILDGIFKQLA